MSHKATISADGKYLYTEHSQEENVKRVKKSAHEAGYSYRSRKNPDGSVSLIVKKGE
jgi:hypothetical protein